MFGKRKNQDLAPVPKVGLAAPVVVQEGDLERARSLMAQFNQGVGTDAGLRGFGVAFNRAGGFISDLDAIHAVRDNPDALSRPWFWAAAVAREALSHGDALLVAQIALMTQFWDSQIGPHLGMADYFDGIVVMASDGAKAQVFAVAMQALPTLPGDTVVMENTTGVRRAADVLTLSAGELLKVEGLVNANTAATARQVLGR